MGDQDICGKSVFHAATSSAAENHSSMDFPWHCEKALEEAVPAHEAAAELPIDWKFNDSNLISIIAFSILLVAAAVGNVTVLLKLLRKGVRRARVNLLLLHLFVADLLVVFLMMPIQIAWNLTVSWNGGDALCRVMSVLRVFGLYLSGFIVMSISVDCCFAVLKPLHMHRTDVRVRIMLMFSWIGSIICSIPQAFVFHVETYPEIPGFQQCVSFGFFPNLELHILYNVFVMSFLHSFPLLVLVTCYLCVLYKICAANKQTAHLRRSSTIILSRAKRKTLKMTITIVCFSSLCWVPDACLNFWYLVDRQSAQQLYQRIQRVVFIIACTSTCFNPLVYGYFHLRRRTEVMPPHPHPCRLEEQAEGSCNVRWRALQGSKGGHSAADAVGISDESNRPAPAQSADIKTAASISAGGQLESSEEESNVVIVFDPQAVCQASATLKFTVQSREVLI